ncbi:hypothetical protein Sme01_01310 [Sphaerisporangium melleum]|uniref:Knr4/Smi1-like domain-containing protein n=1 Tax=Sphaerisporangium melleum TaxID=321316 RepID=A0A917VJV6_9ACTN|nr:SMI1/KNR4 family protein [Sphaerisporangium melleum]GGK88285.1 hypothetical protein GCM10007964_33640 [Sphaerisporangium melleum]GII67655.1 hypothetical protein Sme01_01310 [Sphaerisporangium melleum]
MRRLITHAFARRALGLTAAGAAVLLAAYVLRAAVRRRAAAKPPAPGPPPVPGPAKRAVPALVKRPAPDGRDRVTAPPRREADAGPAQVVPRRSAGDVRREAAARPSSSSRTPRRSRWRRWAIPVALLGVVAVAGAVAGVRAVRDGAPVAIAAVTPPASPVTSVAPAGSPVAGAGERRPGPDAVAAVSATDPSAASSSSCVRVGGPFVVRPVHPKVARAVDGQWLRVERWLKAHAPVTYARLRPPARTRTIAIAEAQMGIPLPASLRASLLRHDGSGPGGLELPGWQALGVREIRDAWRALCTERTSPPAAPGTGGWDPGLIPFAVSTVGAALPADPMVAVADGRDGGVRVLNAGGSPAATGARWTSYYALLTATVRSLRTGTVVDGLRPTVTGGRLLWVPAR